MSSLAEVIKCTQQRLIRCQYVSLLPLVAKHDKEETNFLSFHFTLQQQIV